METVRSIKQVHFDPEFLVEDEERKHQAQARQEEKKVRLTVTADRVFTLAHALQYL